MNNKKILIRVLICCIIATCFLQAGMLSDAATGEGSVISSGDLNNDGVVNMKDVTILSKVFNSSVGDSKYIESCDLNNDGAINMFDVVIISKNFNKVVATATPALTATPTKTVTPTKTATPTKTPTPTIKPTSTMGAGDWNYNSDTTNISIKKVQKGSGMSKITYYAADITLSGDSTFLTAFSENKYGGRNVVLSKIVKDKNAIFAVNGDNYSYRDDGYVIRNGQLYREKTSNRDCLILKKNGLMETAYEKSVSASTLLANGANQVLSFGPILVKSGKALTTFEHVPDDQTPTYLTQQAHPRTGIGMIEPNHFIVIVVDGRVPESEGILMSDFAKLFADLGCTLAYNLDGGGSSEMYFNGKVINNPNTGRGERQMCDALYIEK